MAEKKSLQKKKTVKSNPLLTFTPIHRALIFPVPLLTALSMAARTTGAAVSSQLPKGKKRALLDDSDSESSDDGGASLEKDGFTVNEEYARRFEHNKKREEIQRCESVLKRLGMAMCRLGLLTEAA